MIEGLDKALEDCPQSDMTVVRKLIEELLDGQGARGWQVVDQSRFVRRLEDSESLPRRCALLSQSRALRATR